MVSPVVMFYNSSDKGLVGATNLNSDTESGGSLVMYLYVDDSCIFDSSLNSLYLTIIYHERQFFDFYPIPLFRWSVPC